MFFCLFSYLFCRVTLEEGLGIEDHSDYPLPPYTNDEGVSYGGVISPAGVSLLPAHVVCHGKFILVIVLYFFDGAHQSPYELLLCSSVRFISS